MPSNATKNWRQTPSHLDYAPLANGDNSNNNNGEKDNGKGETPNEHVSILHFFWDFCHPPPLLGGDSRVVMMAAAKMAAAEDSGGGQQQQWWWMMAVDGSSGQQGHAILGGRL
jgi:hypothetical protein